MNIISKDNKKEDKKVTICSKKLQKTIGNWLGILKNERFVRKQKLDKIDNTFGMLLESIGITGKITIGDFNRDVFPCFVYENDNITCLNMSLRWTDGYDFNSQLYISSNNKVYIYDLDNFSKSNDISLILRSYKISNPLTGTVIERYITQYFYTMTITNNDKQLTIRVDKNTEPYTENFILDNEDEFDNYLLSLTSPFPVDDIYDKFYMLCLNSGITNPDIKIKNDGNLVPMSLKRQKEDKKA